MLKRWSCLRKSSVCNSPLSICSTAKQSLYYVAVFQYFMLLKDAYLFSWVFKLKLFFVAKPCTPMGFQSNSTLDEQAFRRSTAEVRKIIDKSVILLNIICLVQCAVYKSQAIKNLSLPFLQWTEMANVQQKPTAVRWAVPS